MNKAGRLKLNKKTKMNQVLGFTKSELKRMDIDEVDAIYNDVMNLKLGVRRPEPTVDLIDDTIIEINY